ncbi:hypothetical protein AX17_002826 [Amanita inopinata Kibby_2008]|nr:hypothetical protein AX17_002826 [Amanita inopinata Kibby_2008]
MQAQSVRTEAQVITSSQSLTAIQTLLRAGLGCITFLRNLLPDDNFTESYFTTACDSGTGQSPDSSISSLNHSQKRNVSGFKIMTMTRGYTEEADRILDYLEYGIFDALQKQYLRSFIFAIYLDSKDPNNIVEAYTFNFRYQSIPGTDATVPILSLGDDLQKLSLEGQTRQGKDPVTEAVLKGRVPTLREVKKSVKSLLKTLIHAMTQMDVLPKRRYATFKIFYTEKTPADYEPPHFQAGDAERDKWYFMTHDLDEVPDRWSIGRVSTGHHTVNLSVASVATYLPSSTELDNAAFEGITSQRESLTTLTPEQETYMRARQAEDQLHDADGRNIAWSVEEDGIELCDVDAEGEDDPDYTKLPDGSYERTAPSTNLSHVAPVGIRGKEGVIEPLHMAMDADEAYFGGISDVVPTKLAELAQGTHTALAEIEQTQSIGGSISVTASMLQQEISTVNVVDQATTSDSTKGLGGVENSSAVLDSAAYDAPGMRKCDPPHSINLQGRTASDKTVDTELNCECSITAEDPSCFCEGGCGRWYHLWCMGYHSVKDRRIPTRFICFDCRLRADLSWELVKIDLYPKILSKFQELVTFRRAIKIAELKKPKTPAEFAKSFGGDHGLARQLFKRLELEGFIYDQSTTTDGLSLAQTNARCTRNKGKVKSKAVKKKTVHKSTYVFNKTIKASPVYMDYFDPSHDVEARLMGLSELKTSWATDGTPKDIRMNTSTTLTKTCNLETASQTQEETQIVHLANLNLVEAQKRSSDTERPRKKVKISVAAGVDLAE